MKEPEHLVQDLEQVLAESNMNRIGQQRRQTAPIEFLKKSTALYLIQYCLVEWSIIFACWLGLFLCPFWLYPLWMIIIIGRLHAFGVILHDATHLPLKGKPLGMRIVEILAGYPVATTLNAMRYHHLRHHRNNGMHDDPYYKPMLRKKNNFFFFLLLFRYIILMPLWTIRAPYGLMASLFPKMRTSYARVFLQDKSGKDLSYNSEVITCARAEPGQVIFQILVLVCMPLYPFIVVYGYLIPLWITGIFAGYRVLCEHNYQPTKDQSLETTFETTNDHHLGFIGKLIFAPRNIGYHIVHHLHPQVGLQYLPSLRDWYREKYPNLYPAAKNFGFKFYE